MQRTLDTMTATKTVHTISIGLVVATGLLVVVSVAAAAIYTLANNAVSSATSTDAAASDTSSTSGSIDRTITIPGQ